MLPNDMSQTHLMGKIFQEETKKHILEYDYSMKIATAFYNKGRTQAKVGESYKF